MKANVKTEYKLYKLTERYGQVNKSCVFFQYLFVIIHLICAAFLMILNISVQLKESVPFFGETIITFQQKYMVKQTALIFAYGYIVLNLLFILVVGIRLSLMPLYNEFNKNEKIQKYLSLCTVFLGYVHQLTVYIIGWSVAYIYKTEGFFVFLGFALLPTILYTNSNIKLDTTSLYKWFTMPLIFLITFLQTPFSYFLIIGVSVYFICTGKMLIKKISLGLIIILSLFVLKYTISANSHPKQMLISLISLVILTLLFSLLIFKLKNQSLIPNQEASIQKLFNLLAQIKTNPYNELKFKQFHYLYSTVMSFAISNKDSKNKQMQYLIQKQPQKVTKTDFLFLLQKYLDKEIKKPTNNNFHKQIIRFKIKIELNSPLVKISQQLFQLHEEYLRSNKKNQNQFFQLIDQAIHRYSIFNEEILQTAFIFHMNQLHQDFQTKIIELLDKIDEFWKNMIDDQIKRSQLDQFFDGLKERKKQIQKLSQQMQKYGNFQRQKRVLENLQILFNSYIEDNKISTQHIKNISQQNQQQIYHSFLILQDNLIRFVSNDLLKNLGQKGYSSYENVNKKTLFGQQFSSIVDNMINNMNIGTQKQWFTIPILRKDGLIDLKKINIMWYPSLQTKCRLMVQFLQDPELKKEGYMIYEIKSDTIKYANQKFVSNFQINKEKFLQKLNNQQMFFNQLFTQGDVSSEQVKRDMKEDTLIKCKIYLKGFIERGQIDLVGVEIKVVKLIAMPNTQGYCILRVIKADERKGLQLRGRKNSQVKRPRQRQRTLTLREQLPNSNQRSLSLKYEKQKFFCPIPNNYETKITQKQAQLQQQNRWVWRYYIHLLVGLMFVTIIVIWGLDYKFISDRIASYRGERAAIQNTSQQYALLYQLYTIVTKKHYMRKYPEQIQLATNKTFQTVEVFYNNQQQAAIDQFLRRYLTQINQQPNEKINYNLQFEFFNITSDSQRSTLLDFAQKFKRNLVNNDIVFLLKNYDSFRNLTIKYETSFTFDERIEDIISSYYIYFYILIASTSVCTCCIFYTLFKIQTAISVVYQLMELLQSKKFEQNCKKFKAKKEKIVNSLHRPLSNSKQITQKMIEDYNPNQVSSYSNNQTCTVITITEISHNQSQSTLQATSSNQLVSKNNFNDNLPDHELNQNQINQKKALLDQNPTEIKPTLKKRLIDEPMLLKINRKLYFIILFIIFNVVFYVDYLSLFEQKAGRIQTSDTRRSLYISLLHLKRIQTDAIIQPLMSDYFNHPINDPYQTSKVDLISDVSKDFIFKQLQDFKEKARTLLDTDMCTVVGKSLTQNVKPCNSYLKGIVTKGFGQTFDIYQLNAKVLSTESLYDFGPYLCKIQRCTPYYEHVYVSALMADTIRAVIKILNTGTFNFSESLLKKTQMKILCRMGSLFILLVIYGIYNESLKKRCKRSIDYFRMIPKEVMCTMKVTSFMRKNEILSQFDIL